MLYKTQVLPLVSAIALLLTACGEDDPSGGGEYFPLSVGDYWVYEETMPSSPSVTLRYDVTDQVTLGTGSDAENELQFIDGEFETFVLTNSFPGGSAEIRKQFLFDDGDRIVRIKHDIIDELGEWTKSREYAPGFLRLDRKKMSRDEEWTEELTQFTDTEPLIDDEPLEEPVQYSYRVVEEHQEVTVPAGTFNCLVIERSVVYGTVGEVKIYYFAPGVGKVKEITEDVKEENLVEYSVAKPDDAV